MYRVIGALVVCMTVGSGAAAQSCAADPVMTCTFSDGAKTLTVCAAGEIVSYSYGPTSGAADLHLRPALADIDYTPWPGVGADIWETVTFYNSDYSYEVFAGVDRNAAENPPYGGIIIRRSGIELATLECDEGTVQWSPDGGLSDHFAANNLCWGGDPAIGWQTCD